MTSRKETPSPPGLRLRLDGRRVVVTGAAGYVGWAILTECLAEGATVAGIDLRASSGSPHPERGIGLVADINNIDNCEHAVGEAVLRLGGLDVLINAAGVMLNADGEVESSQDWVWQQTFETNVHAIRRLCRLCLPHLAQRPGGSIVNVASLVATRGSSISQLAYTASKGAVVAMTRELAVSLAARGIRANSVSPGPLAGGVMASLLNDEAAIERRSKSIPMGRLGSAVEVARACVFLASTDSSFITGIDLLVDGGASAAFLSGVGDCGPGNGPEGRGA